MLKHHGVKTRLLHQWKNVTEYFSPYIFEFPRGYALENFDSQRNFALNTWSASADYSFPLWYPDWDLSSYLYIKRVRANIFGDMARVQYGGFYQLQSSIGVDINLDVHLFQIFFPLSPGIRLGMLPYEGYRYLQFLFDISLPGF
ncbi:MAG: hypothetical protein HC896_16510 [Bacteroidales bacterium]|nr:hypothetical protein [Bacteroidales bacterium]